MSVSKIHCSVLFPRDGWREGKLIQSKVRHNHLKCVCACAWLRGTLDQQHAAPLNAKAFLFVHDLLVTDASWHSRVAQHWRLSGGISVANIDRKMQMKYYRVISASYALRTDHICIPTRCRNRWDAFVKMTLQAIWGIYFIEAQMCHFWATKWNYDNNVSKICRNRTFRGWKSWLLRIVIRAYLK